MDTGSRLLKYRFDSLDQLQRHLHVVEGRTLFFYRDPRTDLASGAGVLLEVSFVQSEQATMLRGHVLSRDDGQLSGAWLELPDARISRRMEEGFSPRKQRRFGCDLMVEVRQRPLPRLCRMIDVSQGGAGLAFAAGLQKGPSEVRLIGREAPWPDELGRVMVIRADASGAGMRFLRNDPLSRTAVSRLLQLVQESWSGAPQAIHAPACCKAGAVLEPPIPHLKKRS